MSFYLHRLKQFATLSDTHGIKKPLSKQSMMVIQYIFHLVTVVFVVLAKSCGAVRLIT